MERELLVTGIGGQGVQLMATVLAQAAVSEGRGVQLFGSYGGMMRGGNTDATLVVAEGPVQSPPTVGAAWSAVVMHHEHAAATLSRLRPAGVVLLNSSVCAPHGVGLDVTESPVSVVEVAATDIAADLGDALVAAMVMAGAYATYTALVSLDALRRAAAAALPGRRAHHAARNDEAIVAGSRAVPALGAPAWVLETSAS